MKKKLLLFGSIILVASIAIGAELQSFYKAKFSGLNTTVNIRLLQDDEASDLSNFALDEIGSIKERDIFGQYNATSGALGSNFITGLFKHYTTDSKYFFACAGTSIGLGSGGAFTDISPTNSTVIAGSYYSGVSFNNRFYLFNPKDEMFIYSGTGSFHKAGIAQNIPSSNCAYSATHKARVWAARSDSYPYRLYFSSLNTAENWVTSGGYIDLPDINQEITGIISWGGYLYIFTETNVYILLGSTPNDFSLRKTNSMVGAVAPRSIKITDIGICFLSRSGVYAFDGNNSNKISTKIETTIASISKTLIKNACSIYDGQRYWLSYTPQGSSYNTKILIYDSLTKDWTIYEGSACNISYFERAYGGSDKGELYGGSSMTNGIVYQLQSASGEEGFTHSTQADFNNDVTFNTVVTSTPKVELTNGVDYSTSLMAHFNGVDAQTSYTSDDSDRQVFTFANTAQLDTAQVKFGTSSLYIDGLAGTYAYVGDSDKWNFGTDPFTIDFWIRFAGLADEALITHYQDANNRWSLMYDSTNHYIKVQSVYLGANNILVNATAPLAVGTWYHIAVVRTDTSSTGLKVYVDGVSKPVALQDGAWSGSFPDITGNLEVGRTQAGAYVLNGWIDELRITKGIARWTTDFDVPVMEYYDTPESGTLTSQNVQINTAGASNLGTISWINTLPSSDTKVTFQTRTGATSDSVYFNGWQYWTSANSVTLSTVTSATTTFLANGRITVAAPASSQSRDILYYEDENSTAVNCARFQTYGAVSTNAYVNGFLTYTDLSDYDWLTAWYKSPSSGNSVEFYMSNDQNTLSNNCVTFNTVWPNTWEKAYWYIGNIPDSEKNGIRYIRAKYKGENSGYIYLGEVEAHNYYDSGDNISSTPNDWIQYRAILGTDDQVYSPKLSSVTLTYTPELSVQETSLSSYYYTKWFDFQSPQIGKQFDSMVLEVNSTSASSVSPYPCTIYCDYDIDFGTKTGTLSFIPSTTANTVRILKNFPSSTYGKSMRLKIYNSDKDAQVTIKGAEIRFRKEAVTPD